MEYEGFVYCAQQYAQPLGCYVDVLKRSRILPLNKQKVNSTSSTVAEILGMNNAMNFVIWVKFIIEQQV